MALTPSNMMSLGTKAPDFDLYDVMAESHASLSDVSGVIGTMVMFICNHCPYVIHIQEELVEIAKEYSENGIGFVGISSNDVDNYPDDSPEHMRRQGEVYEFVFPYLFDETQEVARSYDAACTPDFFLFDRDLKLVYRGRMDESRPGNDIPVTGMDMRAALDALIEGKPQAEMQYPSMGCNIKWKV